MCVRMSQDNLTSAGGSVDGMLFASASLEQMQAADEFGFQQRSRIAKLGGRFGT